MVYVKLSASNIDKARIGGAKHFDEKNLLIKDQFNADVQDILGDSYGLLSKSIHELKNEENEEFYRLILEVINVQLESEKEEADRKEKLKKLRSKNNNVVSKHNVKKHI